MGDELTIQSNATPSPDLRCSSQTRGLGELLAGSATAADRFLLVELPLPWPNKIEAHPMLMGLPKPAEGHGHTRVLAVRRDDNTDSNRHRIISYRQNITDGGFSGFIGAETEVGSAQLETALTAVLTGDESSLVAIGDVTDLLLCTHGTRDRCCGSLGSVLVMELQTQLSDQVRLWKTSHTGGHRFAPTGITFPDGLTWGFLDLPLMLGILDRSLEPELLTRHLRGCAGFEDRATQVADAVLFARHGWSWLDRPRSHRSSTDNQPGASDGALAIECETASTRNQVRLSVGDPVPVPACAEPLEAAKKTTAQFIVEAITGD